MIHRRLLSLAAAGLLVVGGSLGSPAVSADEGIRVAVAPFAQGDVAGGESADLATLLSDAMATRSLARLVSPSDLTDSVSGVRAGAREAREVRAWAEGADVDAVVVGTATPARRGPGFELAIEVRSGHSGASLAQFADDVADIGAFRDDVDSLAGAVLASLGYVEPEPLPPVAAVGSVEEETDEEAGIDVSGFRSKEPIEINSEELEVIQEDEMRHLIFSSNVRVDQADMHLQADRLEAFYPEGSSQPDKLIARGRVRVRQGDRRASCDEAIYERVAEVLTCSGRAELLQGCDRVRGQLIRFDLAGERVRVTGAPSVVIYPGDESPDACEDLS